MGTPTRSFLDSISDAVLGVDSESCCTYCNDTLRRLAGVGDESIVGRPLRDVLSNAFVDALEGPLRRALSESRSYSFRALDPVAEVWHDGRIVPTDPGALLFFRCVDETDEEGLGPMEDALRLSHEQFMALADATPQIVWLLSPSGSVLYLNEKGTEYFGEDIANRSTGWTPMVHPDDLPLLQDQWGRALSDGSMFESEIRLLRYDGTYRWHLARALPVRDENHDVSHWCGTSTDIHDLKVALVEVETREAQSRFLAEASPLLTSSLDYESTLDIIANLMVPRLADWCAVDILGPDGSPHLVTVAHVQPEKVRLGLRLRQEHPPDMSTDHGLANVLRHGKSQLYPEITDEMLVLSATDEEHLETLRAIGFRSALSVPLIARNQILGALTLVWSDSQRYYTEDDLRFAEELARRAAIVIDNSRLYKDAREAREELEQLNETLEARVKERTTALMRTNKELRREVEERRRAQRALARANTMLERKNRELQDFAHVASHDLQEPLRKIMSFATLLDQEHGERLMEGRPYIERIVGSADRMMNLIRDLLSFSRVATQGEPPTEIYLNDVLDEVLLDLEVQLSETAGRVESDDLGAIDADPIQIRQLFQNLISNALKFHREGVPPVITIERVDDGTYRLLRFSDNGIGFDGKYVDRIFAPFQRLHGKGSYPGTGMGLAICRRIVERHDGSISAVSTPGKGSSFEVRLPVRQNAEGAAA